MSRTLTLWALQTLPRKPLSAPKSAGRGLFPSLGDEGGDGDKRLLGNSGSDSLEEEALLLKRCKRAWSKGTTRPASALYQETPSVPAFRAAPTTKPPSRPRFPLRIAQPSDPPTQGRRDHSFGPSAVASLLAPCLQRSTPCRLLPCETQISKMHSATWRFLLETLLGSLFESHCFQK